MSEMRLSEIAFVSGAAVLAGLAGGHEAQAQGIGGAYGGFTFGKAVGGHAHVWGSDYSINGPAVGGFVGYNMVQGPWVFGGEIALSSNYSIDLYDFSIDKMVDLKARAGHSFGNSFVYGVVGYSRGGVSTGGYFAPEDIRVSGMSLGIGFETPLAKNAFIGGEILSRKLSTKGTVYGSIPATDYININRLTTATIRIGFHF